VRLVPFPSPARTKHPIVQYQNLPGLVRTNAAPSFLHTAVTFCRFFSALGSALGLSSSKRRPGKTSTGAPCLLRIWNP